ncbi:MAG: hypothetical protein Q4C34_00015 [Bacteroidales bacterium]|nr:hypothetical protein [Bacteroidales bacterium]
MANRRQIKKRISQVCGELASDILIASYYFDNVDRDKVEEIVNDIAVLQEDSRAKVSFGFDKTLKDFEGDGAAYRKARHAYNKAAFGRLREQFGERALAIVKAMNEAVPAEVRKALSK